MCEEIPKRQKNKCTIKGVVKNYKNCDDIWIFYAENVFLRTESESFTSEKLKVVACDTQIRSYYEDKRTQKKEINEDGG
jgi:transcription initiation factor TFIIA small subunit